MKFQEAINKLSEGILEESFEAVSNDNRYRIYANPKACLVELEEMDDDGQMQQVIASFAFNTPGCPFSIATRRVFRFNGFVERWVEQFEGNLDRSQAMRVFSHFVELAILSVHDVDALNRGNTGPR